MWSSVKKILRKLVEVLLINEAPQIVYPTQITCKIMLCISVSRRRSVLRGNYFSFHFKYFCYKHIYFIAPICQSVIFNS